MGVPTLDTSQKTTSSNSGTWTLAHTCSGSDRYLKVSIVRGSATASVNYNGTGLTLIRRLSFSALVTMVLEVWGLVNPTTGANNIQIVGPGGAPDAIVLIAESFNGVHQTVPLGTNVFDFQDNQTDLSSSVTASSTTDDLITDAFISYSRTMAANGGQTETQNGGNTGAQSVACSYKTGASSVSLGWTVGSNQLRGMIAVPLLASVPTPIPMQRGRMFFAA